MHRPGLPATTLARPDPAPAPVTARGLPPAAGAVGATVGQLAEPVAVLPGDLPVLEADRLLRRDPSLRGLVARRDGSLLLLTRQRADDLLAGNYGFGRALLHRSVLADVLPARSLVLAADTPLAVCAREMLLRPDGDQHDDAVVVWEDGRVGLASASAVFRQISDLYQRMALHDPLTGLPNRLVIEHRAAELMGEDRTPDAERGPALLYVDLDHFKRVNDTLGHRAGDEVLVEVAARLLAVVRPEDLVARLGGDEFAVLLATVTPLEAETVAERMVMSMAAPFLVAETPIYIGASVGIARAGDTVAERTLSFLEVLLRRADAAMYQAKAGGRGRVHVLTGRSDDAAAERRAAVGRRLHKAIPERALSLHFQPKVRLRDREVVEVEALLRWDDAELGQVGPAEFIPVAESTGLINALGVWVLHEACRQTQAWREQGHDLSVAVNVSPLQLCSPDLIADVSRVLGQTGLPATRLRLEITESAAMHDVARTVEVLEQLRALGIRVSLDDFGTGYSSLAMLGTLPLHGVKIDRSFVSQLGTGQGQSSTLVRLVVEAAHAYGMTVIAEGVETEDQLAAITELGCDAAQGYLLGRPAPAERLELAPR